MSSTSLQLIVTALDDSVPGIRSVTLASLTGATLPGFVAGSHLTIQAGTRTNAYSLTGDGLRPEVYTISVLRVEDGNGGSAWIHEQLALGDVITAHAPRSAFAPVARATKHLLIAGGIGITPIISHLRAARAWGREVQVMYTFRAGYAAHLDDLAQLAPGAELITGGPEQFLVRLRENLLTQPIGTHLYVCGPGAMIDAVLDTASDCGWPPSRLHLERFGQDALAPGEAFTVTLAKTGRTVEVASGTSMLDALEGAGVAVPSLCRQGVCGECKTTVTGGKPLHRDLFLTDEEKACGDALMPCVSRADGAHLEVAL